MLCYLGRPATQRAVQRRAARCSQSRSCSSRPMSSRHAQCSTIMPSATRQMWMKVHAVGRPETGAPASSGIVDARWVPCSVRCCATRSPSPMRWCCSTVTGPRSWSMVPRMSFETLAALRTGGVVDHVLGDEVVQHGVVAVLLAPEQLLDDVLRGSLAHRSPSRPPRRPRVMPSVCPVGHRTSSVRSLCGSVTPSVARATARTPAYRDSWWSWHGARCVQSSMKPVSGSTCARKPRMFLRCWSVDQSEVGVVPKPYPLFGPVSQA